jgi:predicted nucleic acid-binding protein
VVLVDTSVWIDFFRRGGPLARLLEENRALVHPFVIGELACGHLKDRNKILGYLRDLPMMNTATDEEVLCFIDNRDLAGCGVGYLDMHLLASVQLYGHAKLWTKDKKLAALAGKLALSN